MSRASVTTFGRGVSFVASGETGTQANEFEAAIKSVTSSTTVGAVFVYDTRNDSDGGAWRKKARGSWYYETLNTATRGGRREFPSVCLIVADGASPDTVSLYDLDDPAAPLWLQFKRGTASWTAGNMGLTDNNLSSVFALNGRIYIGQAAASGLGVEEISFVDDTGYRYTASATAGGYYNGNIAERLDGKGWAGSHSRGNIVNGVVNDVAATIVEGAEIGALGLPIPTIACATAGGVSVIHPNGDVYDQTNIVASTVNAHDIAWVESGGLFWSSRKISESGTYIQYLRNTLYADSSSTTDKVYYPKNLAGSNKVPFLASGGPYVNAVAATKNGLGVGNNEGLSLIKHNDGNPDEGAVAYITSTYNTGYMLGDIKGAWLTGGDASADGRYDRSVGNTDLVENGTVLHAAAETDAEVTKYYDFSASNYFSQAHNTDFDFGTGDFSIMFWCKLADTVNTTETVLERAYGGNAFFNVDFQNGIPRLIAYNGSAYDTTTGTKDLSDNQWHQLMCFRKDGVVYIYIDGKQHVSNAMTYDLDNSQAILHIGQTTGNGNPLANGSLSLLRISATAPTPQQAKDIYEAEAPLFRAGAKCLLQGNSNTVNALGYDTSTDLLHAGTGAATGEEGVTVFKGLEAVDTFKGQDVVGVYDNPNNLTGWVANSIKKLSVAGGVSAYGRTDGSVGGVIVDLPAIDVRGDINTADTKLPDDGKFHFSGVTTDATPTVIGQIPIAENESYTVIARVMGLRYNTADSSIRHFCEIKQQFTRRVSGDVVEETQISKLEEGDWAQLAVDLDYDTGADTIRVKVTGDGSSPTPYRVVWKADVEVQRISEKQYER